MQRIIQQITRQLIDKLPDNDQYYRLDELRSWGLPSFIVRRIKIELERNLAESMIIPKTDWANTQSDAVQDAWQQFVDAIRAEARLPASYAKTVIETSVADVLEILVQPRKNIPKIVFAGDGQLSQEEVRQRVKLIVVYQHFGQLIPRYMQKKELNQLSKERCGKVISNADEKLTERYSPLNWAQMLEPLFKLVDGEIDTNLLRLFFEDKKMPRVARKFDLMNKSLTRAELIEVLSSPELLDFEGYEDEQSTLFEDQPETAGRETSELQTPVKPREDRDQEEAEEQTAMGVSETSQEITGSEDENKESDEAEAEQTLNSGFVQEDEKADDAANEDEAFGALNDVFDGQEEETKPDERQEPPEPVDEKSHQVEEEQMAEPAEISDKGFGEQAENLNDGENAKNEDSFKQEETDPEKMVAQSQDNGQENDSADADDEETPIWMRYMSDEEIEEYKEQQEQEEQEDQDKDEVEEGFIDDPVIDLTNEDASDKEIENLREILQSDRELFVEEIFRGSDRAYDEAVEDIAAYGSWRDVSKYIEKEIFKRNLVDMYSEAAVDFTDRLQTYFLEKQNQSN